MANGKRQKQPLINKLENVLPLLIKLITHPDYKVLKDKFPIPNKDISTGLYTPNFDSPFYKGYQIKTKSGNNDLDIKFDEDNESSNKESEKNNEDNKKEGDDNQNEEKKEIEKKDKGEI